MTKVKNKEPKLTCCVLARDKKLDFVVVWRGQENIQLIEGTWRSITNYEPELVLDVNSFKSFYKDINFRIPSPGRKYNKVWIEL